MHEETMNDYLQMSVHDLIPPMNRDPLDLALKLFSGPLDLGCTLAGGFVRALYRGDRLDDYFARTKSGVPGDVDIFLPGGIDAASVKDSIVSLKKDSNFLRSHAGFGWDDTLHPRRHGFTSHSVHVQFIDYPEFCSPDPVEVIDRFDFTNAAIAISLVEGKPTLTVHRKWKELEKLRALEIKNVTSPFLGKRIVKYLKRKGLESVSSNSAPKITEWLARCSSSGQFVINGRSFDTVAKDGVMSLFASGLAPKEDIIMFLGKWEVVVSDRREGDYAGFATNRTIDWARSHIQDTFNATR